jgi:PadR family transcriptional regulator PadR
MRPSRWAKATHPGYILEAPRFWLSVLAVVFDNASVPVHHVTPKLIMGETRRVPGGEFLPGTLDMLILKTLSRGMMHGYAITQFIQQASRDVLKVEEGALYPALHRLEVRGLLRAEWGASDNNRRAKFYRLTALGRRELDTETAYWSRVASAVTRVMQTA